MRHRAARGLQPVAHLLFVAACAAGSGTAGGTSPRTVALTVENNLNPPQEVTVRVVEPSGSRDVLGSLGPGSTRTYELREARFSGNYALMAEMGSGETVMSRSFTLFPEAQVLWTLRSNQVTVSQEY